MTLLINIIILAFMSFFPAISNAAITYSTMQAYSNDGTSQGRTWTGVWVDFNGAYLPIKFGDNKPKLSFEFMSDYKEDWYSIGFAQNRTPLDFKRDVSTNFHNNLGNQFFLSEGNINSGKFERFFGSLSFADKAIVATLCKTISSTSKVHEIVELAIKNNRHGSKFETHWRKPENIKKIVGLAKICVEKTERRSIYSDGMISNSEIDNLLLTSPDKSVKISSIRAENWLGNQNDYGSGTVVKLISPKVSTLERQDANFGTAGFLWDGELEVSSSFDLYGKKPCCPGTAKGTIDGFGGKIRFKLLEDAGARQNFASEVKRSSTNGLLISQHILERARIFMAKQLVEPINLYSKSATKEEYVAFWNAELFKLDLRKSINIIQQELSKRFDEPVDDLKKYQMRLKELGYYKSVIDGKSGPGTRNAIFAFQNDNGLYEDGYLSSYEIKLLLEGQETKQVKGSETLSDVKILRENLDAAISNYSRLQKQYVVLKNELDRLKSTGQQNKSSSKNIDEDELKTLRYNLSAVQSNYKRLVQRASDLDVQVAKLKEENKKLSASSDTEWSRLTAEVARLKDDLNFAQQKYNTMSKRASELSKDLNEKDKLLAEEIAKKSSSNEANELAKTILQDRIQSTTRQLDEAKTQINDLYIKNNNSLIELSKLSEANKKLTTDLEQSKISLSDQKSAWLSEKKTLNSEIASLKNLSSASADDIDQLRNENQRLNIELNKAVDEINESAVKNNNNLRVIDELENKISFLQQDLAQIPNLKQKIEQLEEKLKLAGQQVVRANWRDVAKDDPSWSDWLNDMPIKQVLFCDVIQEYDIRLSEALASQNQIRTNLVMKERKLELDGLLPRGELEGWIGRVFAVTQTDTGDAAVLLELPCGINVGSGVTSFNGKQKWEGAIPYEDRMYRELVKVGKGDFVILNAELLEIDEGELGEPEYKFASNLANDKDLPSEFQTDNETFIANVKYLVEAKR